MNEPIAPTGTPLSWEESGGGSTGTTMAMTLISPSGTVSESVRPDSPPASAVSAAGLIASANCSGLMPPV
jgi:hypothetical protein